MLQKYILQQFNYLNYTLFSPFVLHAENEKVTHQQLYSIIMEDGIKCAFPNVEVLLRIFLSIMVTNCSGERTFSRLRRIKDEWRSTMSQERLASLSLLCVERDLLHTLTFEDIIDDFAHRKSRKKFI
jgi:hypothetical protein